MINGFFVRKFRVKIVRLIMKAFWIFPVNNKKIFFSAYEGKHYTCNPRSVYEQISMLNDYEEYCFIWELNNIEEHKIITDPRVIFVTHNSLKYIFSILTSKYLITNSGITCYLPLRRQQININTWHGGGAYKRVGYGVKSNVSEDLYELSIVSKQTTYFLSSSKIFTEVMKDSCKIPEKNFLSIGMPRNDVFFDSKRMDSLKRKVLSYFGFTGQEYLVLYAPTYRGIVGKDETVDICFDISKLKKVIEEKFCRKAIIMVRMHYFNSKNINSKEVISASKYPDMQELLVAVNMLITDYSSSMWDFALTNKPCILYTPDLDMYDLERGFYTRPEFWPGILCKSEDKMYQAIYEYREKEYNAHISKYLEKAGNYESGTAISQVLKLIK